MEWLDNFWSVYSNLVLTLGINALLALSVYLTLSCGLLAMANAAFMGISTYTAALLTMNAEMPFSAALLGGMATPAVVAVVIGRPTLRLSGVYLAMTTLGFGEVVRVLILDTENWTDGTLGLNDIPQSTEWWHVAVTVLATLFVPARIRRSKVGRTFEAIKEDGIVAELIGINVVGTKLLTFTLGAAIAGLAGVLNAHLTLFISPNEFGFDHGVEILTMTILGDTNDLTDPVLGSLIPSLLPELLRAFKDFRLVVDGVILMVITLFLPRDIWGPTHFARWFDIKHDGTMPGTDATPVASSESH